MEAGATIEVGKYKLRIVQDRVLNELPLQFLDLVGVPINSVVKATIIQIINGMRAKGHAKSTIRTAKWLLHSIYEEAIDNDLVQKTPVRRISLKGIPDAEETRPFSEDEVRRIFNATSGRLRMIRRVMIGCGLRPGELSALRRNDVGETLRVDEAYEPGQFKPPKNGRTRYVPMSAALRAELQAWLKSSVDPAPKALLFPMSTGRAMSESGIRKTVGLPRRELTGITDLRPKMVRTTFSTLLNGDIKDVQDLLGPSRTGNDPEALQEIHFAAQDRGGRRP